MSLQDENRNQQQTENSNGVITSDPKTKPKTYRAYDFGLLILTVFLVGLGLVFLYSSSSYTATQKFGNAAFYLKRQAGFAVFGILFMVIVSLIDYKIYIAKWPIYGFRLIYGLYALSLVLQALVLVVGEDIYGAKRWIDIPKIGSFQPSEVTKICAIVFTAFICYSAPKKMNRFGGFLRVMVYMALPILLVAKEDLSTGLVIAGIVFLICFVTSKKWLYFIGMIVMGAGSVVAYIFLGNKFRAERIEGWLNVDTSSAGYQIRRGLYAIAAGGIKGKGLGESSMKLGYVPESHNDMIFSIICEEMGIIGAICIIFLFAVLIWRIYIVAFNAPDLFGSLICIGVMAHIAIQVVMNIAVVTSVIPATGIALPFISYGGSSLVMLLAEMGMVLSVSYHIKNVE